MQMTSTSWKFHLDSASAWNAMLESCQNAKVSIDLEQFVFHEDTIGKQFIAVLKKKASEGVKVRIIFDAAGAYNFYSSQEVRELRRVGAEIIFFNPLIFSNPKNISIWYFRDHRKLLLIDNTVAFTGGICIGDEMKDWRETHVRIEGPVVNDMIYAFNGMWLFARNLVLEERLPRPPLNTSHFRYVTNSPLINRRHLYREVWTMIEQSKKYIYLTTPYFLPDNRILRALKKAKRRGVNIHILIPKYSNHSLADYGSHSYYTPLLKQGFNIHRYLNRVIHSKTVIFDGVKGTIGSLNFDNISLRFNFEANIVSEDLAFIEELTAQFRHDLENTEKLTLEAWQNRSWKEKLYMILVWPIRKFL